MDNAAPDRSTDLGTQRWSQPPILGSIDSPSNALPLMARQRSEGLPGGRGLSEEKSINFHYAKNKSD